MEGASSRATPVQRGNTTHAVVGVRRKGFKAILGNQGGKGFNSGVSMVQFVRQTGNGDGWKMCWEGFPGRENGTCNGLRDDVKMGDVFIYLTPLPVQTMDLYWGQEIRP